MELEIALGVLSKTIFIILVMMTILAVVILLSLFITLAVLTVGRWIIVRIKNEWRKTEADILSERIFKTVEEMEEMRGKAKDPT